VFFHRNGCPRCLAFGNGRPRTQNRPKQTTISPGKRRSRRECSLKTQAFGGYITTKCGKKLAYQLVVNGVPIVDPDEEISETVKVFQDEGRISAILWHDF
jgi:hypothetical protein